MRCPQCRIENIGGRRFCAGCGAALAQSCPACQFVNDADAQFCGGCWRPLTQPRDRAAGLAHSQPPSFLAAKILQSRHTLEGERKQVTVMFADLRGSLELLIGRDPEEAQAFLDPILERMIDAVHHFEGTVNQVMGDGIMALFGAPVAHEDHAVRAGYAAIRMQESIRALADQAQAHDVPCKIRIGLNAGEVVVRGIGNDLTMDYSAVGETTHLAGRMEQLAAPGTILVTETFVRLTEGYLHFKPLGLVAVKGLTEPMEVFELVDAEATPIRFQAAARGLTKFVGRRAEFDALDSALQLARSGQGQALAVIGEPGVGKSRLFRTSRRAYLPYLKRLFDPLEGDTLVSDAWTHPAFRGQGLHSSSTALALRRARDRGFTRSISIVAWWNVAAIRVVLEKAGREVVGTVGYWQLGVTTRHFATGDVRFGAAGEVCVARATP